jgi:hypothetical protein
VKTRLTKSDPTTSDRDIICRRWFPIDIDPVRPSGISSSGAEKTAALDKAEKIMQFLSEMGFPEPIRADSGNGAHLLYRIDLPNSPESNQCIKTCLEVLADLFSDNQVHVDTAVGNPGRIWKLYGTMAQKGDSTPERPHRRATLISAPPACDIVSEELLIRLSSLLPEPKEKASVRSKGIASGIDLRGWLMRYDIPVASERPFKGGVLFRLSACPFSSSHLDGAYAIQFPQGGVYVACHHASCGGGVNRWSELRARMEGLRRGQNDHSCNTNPSISKETKSSGATDTFQSKESPLPGVLQKPGTSPENPAIPAISNITDQKSDTRQTRSLRQTGDQKARALDQDRFGIGPDAGNHHETARTILNSHDPLSYLLETYASVHVGDQCLGRCLALSAASRFVKNTAGLHVSVSGASGKGKSDGMRAMMSLLPDDWVLRSRLSDKALYYANCIRAGMVFLLDDSGISPDLSILLKQAATNFTEPAVLMTVDKDKQARTLTVPERCLWWLANVQAAGDEQVQNRLLSVWVDDSPEQDRAVFDRKRKTESQDAEIRVKEAEQISICKEMWEVLGEDGLVFVHIPFAHMIMMDSFADRRAYDMLVDMIKAHAFIYRFQRQCRVLPDGTLHITATHQDFSYAATLFGDIHYDSGCQVDKMTKEEVLLLESAVRNKAEEFTYKDIQQWMGFSYDKARRLIRGNQSGSDQVTGLLSKTSCLTESWQSRIVIDAVGQESRRSGKVFSFDISQYQMSRRRPQVWIEDDRTPSGGDNRPDEPGPGTGQRNEASVQDEIPSPIVTMASAAASSTASESASRAASGGMNEGVSVNVYQQPASRGLVVCSAEEKEEFSTSNSVYEPVTAYRSGSDPVISTIGNPSDCTPALLISGDITPDAPTRVQAVQRFRSSDYIDMVLPGKGPCWSCGQDRYVFFQERLTPERLSRDNRFVTRRVCQDCFDRERHDEESRIHPVPLPGVIDIRALERIDVSIGTCQICDTEPARFIDRERKVKICEPCMKRLEKVRK